MNLSVTASHVMNPHVILIPDSMPVSILLDLFKDNQISGAPVVDDQGLVVGMVSLTEISEMAHSKAGIPTSDVNEPFDFFSEDKKEIFNDLKARTQGKLLAKHIMTSLIYSITETTTVQDMAKMMVDNRLHRLLVMRGSTVMGIVSRLDLVKLLCV